MGTIIGPLYPRSGGGGGVVEAQYPEQQGGQSEIHGSCPSQKSLTSHPQCQPGRSNTCPESATHRMNYYLQVVACVRINPQYNNPSILNQL
jgi:hypothetical protein